MSKYNEDSPIKVYYCKNGTCIVSAGDETYFDRKTKKEYLDAEKWGRKVETMPVKEFRQKKFGCDCDELISSDIAVCAP